MVLCYFTVSAKILSVLNSLDKLNAAQNQVKADLLNNDKSSTWEQQTPEALGMIVNTIT